ncbi:hypothetical protein GCM10028811_13400 [Uliginosibacterium sediminicola]
MVPPHKERNAVAQAIVLNPKGSDEMGAWLRCGDSPGDHPASVAAPCPAPIAYERNPLPTVNTP